MFQFYKIITGSIALTAVYASARNIDIKLAMRFHFVNNFKGFNREKVELLFDKYDNLCVERPSDFLTRGSHYYKQGLDKHHYPLNLKLIMEDIPDLDPQSCLDRAQQYSDEYFQDEKDHLKRGRQSFWWISHIMRHHFPNEIRFNEWDGDNTTFDIKSGKMWKIINQDSVYKDIVQKMYYVCDWNREISIGWAFDGHSKHPKCYNMMMKSENSAIREEFKKYYIWMRHIIFDTTDFYRVRRSKWSFKEPNAVDWNQAYIILKFIEILQFFTSKRCIDYMDDMSTNIVNYCKGQDKKKWIWQREMSKFWFPIRRRQVWKLARRMRRFVMMFRDPTGKITEEFKKTDDGERTHTKMDSISASSV